MESKELQEIKARAEQLKKLLGNGSDTLRLIEDDLPELVAEIERLRTELGQAGKCPHGDFYRDRTCVECFGDGTEEMRQCGECGTQTWHRGGKCLRHDASAPRPYEPLKAELKKLEGEIQTIEEQSSAGLGQAEERVREIEATCVLMREALEYVKARIGSTNIGESIIKIERALSSSAGNQTREDKQESK